MQYVVDGLPITDNRSTSFAPESRRGQRAFDGVLTGGYPAEYGRKLGGVLEVVTAANPRSGPSRKVVASARSFGTSSGDEALRNTAVADTHRDSSASLAHTDRYLYSPVEENFTNTGTGTNVAFQFDVTSRCRSAPGRVPARTIALSRTQRACPGRGSSAAGTQQSRHQRRPPVVGILGGALRPM